MNLPCRHRRHPILVDSNNLHRNSLHSRQFLTETYPYTQNLSNNVFYTGNMKIPFHCHTNQVPIHYCKLHMTSMCHHNSGTPIGMVRLLSPVHCLSDKPSIYKSDSNSLDSFEITKRCDDGLIYVITHRIQVLQENEKATHATSSSHAIHLIDDG